jgi:hypothetical protein
MGDLPFFLRENFLRFAQGSRQSFLGVCTGSLMISEGTDLSKTPPTWAIEYTRHEENHLQ